MRALILAAGAALAVSACNSDEAANTTTNIDQVLSAQNVTANDTTSIDAATGEDANMAEETVIPAEEIDNEAGNEAEDEAGDGARSNRTAANNVAD